MNASHRIRPAQAAGDALGFPDPTLRTTRREVREDIAGALRGAARGRHPFSGPEQAAQDMPPAPGNL